MDNFGKNVFEFISSQKIQNVITYMHKMKISDITNIYKIYDHKDKLPFVENVDHTLDTFVERVAQYGHNRTISEYLINCDRVVWEGYIEYESGDNKILFIFSEKKYMYRSDTYRLVVIYRYLDFTGSKTCTKVFLLSGDEDIVQQMTRFPGYGQTVKGSLKARPESIA